jgi:hypothetical protein
MTANKSAGTIRKLLTRCVAGVIMVAMYCFNTVVVSSVVSGLALTVGATSAQAHHGGRSRGRGRGRGRGYWYNGGCHVRGTSLWFDC